MAGASPGTRWFRWPVLDIAETLGRDSSELLTADRAALFVKILAAVAEQPGTVVVVEDLHWADDATLDWVRHLGRRVSDRPVLLLTCRDDHLEGGPDRCGGCSGI